MESRTAKASLKESKAGTRTTKPKKSDARASKLGKRTLKQESDTIFREEDSIKLTPVHQQHPVKRPRGRPPKPKPSPTDGPEHAPLEEWRIKALKSAFGISYKLNTAELGLLAALTSKTSSCSMCGRLFFDLDACHQNAGNCSKRLSVRLEGERLQGSGTSGTN